MQARERSERSPERTTVEGKERRKKVVRVRRKTSSRHIPDEDEFGQDRTSHMNESSPTKRKSSATIPELNRHKDLPNASHTSNTYPSFSKAHSREAVGSKENVSLPSRKDIFTPDPTDLQEEKDDDTSGANRKAGTVPVVSFAVPPSPPLTAAEDLPDRRSSPLKARKAAGSSREDLRRVSTADARRGSPLGATRSQESSSRRSSGQSVRASGSTSTLPSRSAAITSTPPIETTTAPSSLAQSVSSSITPKQERRKTQTEIQQNDENDSSPETGSDISIRTPTPRGTPAPSPCKPQMNNSYPMAQPSIFYTSPIPPPPPPPPPVSIQPQRVDYLMQYGGLRQNIPKRFITAPNPDQNSAWVAGELPNPTDISLRVQAFFAPFRDLLNDYTKVIDKSGSIAVATGYRSIARRLLDRLEAVFARDISSEVCACVMCDVPDNMTLDDERGVSWGEILEYVSGRKELPQWPPFVLAHDTMGLCVSHDNLRSPCQTLDIDVPEEYREHYIRQSKKTKESVDRWLGNQDTNTTAPPEEADDDTLTFAILTHLEPQLRPLYREFLGITSTRPNSTAPGIKSQAPIASVGKFDIVDKSKLAIQRLYRLGSTPRAPEVAIFLLRNRVLHNVLATLAAISDAEWEILTSGRFDGFLRSGAEDLPSHTINGRASRGPTPLSSQGSLSASVGAPVAIDEDTEIAVLAEVEREIFSGMEALEDAFESLHTAAEAVRRTLRERGAGLAMAAQSRRGMSGNILEARLGTPASVRGDESEGNDWMDDAFSEIAPDDSASMISKNRIRRKRRDERRTPGPTVEEATSAVHESERHGISSRNAGGGGPSRNSNSYRRRV